MSRTVSYSRIYYSVVESVFKRFTQCMKELHTLCTHSIDKTLLTKVILFYLIFFCFVFSFCCNTSGVSMWISNFTLFSILLIFYRVSWSVFNFRTVPKNVRFTSDFMFTAFLLCVESQNRIAHFFLRMREN
jgi:hypothetical protein